MPHYDLPLAELRTFNPAIALPDDAREFWDDTIRRSRAASHPVSLNPVSSPYPALRTWDVTFAGYMGDDIRGWLHLPADASGPLPGVVEFIGYGGGRGLSHQGVKFGLAGYAHLVMDNRGMGFGGWVSDTPDFHPEAGLSHTPGLMTSGVLSPETYYFRRLITDAVRAVDAMSTLEAVDSSKIAVVGGSMGGGLALAVSALSDLAATAMIDVPFLSNLIRAIRISDRNPYLEVAQYLQRNRDKVVEVENTLSYFDVAALAPLATAPALFSVGLMDAVCPPSTVFAAFNSYGGPKQIVEYEFNDHEGGQEHHDLRHYEWLTAQFG